VLSTILIPQLAIPSIGLVSISRANFILTHSPLILGYLALDQSIAYTCNALKAKYSLVQRELYRHSRLASQFNYEGSA
jgi:hypothetical protein